MADIFVALNTEMSSAHTFRHEVGVAYSPVEIIYADDQLIVVNKPASVPVSERQITSTHFG